MVWIFNRLTLRVLAFADESERECIQWQSGKFTLNKFLGIPYTKLHIIPEAQTILVQLGINVHEITDFCFVAFQLGNRENRILHHMKIYQEMSTLNGFCGVYFSLLIMISVAFKPHLQAKILDAM
jgi:hypothetical protein